MLFRSTRFTPEAVQEKYGLTPAQYPDFAAVRGDPSDNLPSIPGIGEKTAAKWIREFGSLAELVDRVGEVGGKAGEKLRDHLAAVLLNRQLTELARDVPLQLVHDDSFEYDVQRRVPSTEKAKRVLGFEATTTLEQMLAEVIPWIASAVEAGSI